MGARSRAPVVGKRRNESRLASWKPCSQSIHSRQARPSGRPYTRENCEAKYGRDPGRRAIQSTSFPGEYW